MADNLKHSVDAGDDAGERRESYADKVAARIVEQLQQGTAPWQRPWKPGELRLPFNPTTNAPYRGFNAVWLAAQGNDDPRWMTYKQAASVGAQVRGGEKGTVIQFAKFRGEEPMLDESGKPVLDADGKQKTQQVEYDRPKIFHAVVFNAAQIDGLPALEARATSPEWQRHERIDAILEASGVGMRHVAGDAAYYEPGNDRITLPERGQFDAADKYYATALHELGHATGHPSRLDRDMANPFGSEAYAKEELRAELASLMLGERLEVGHDPGQHAAYVGSWIKALREDPRELFRAAADAEKIAGFVMGIEQKREQEQGQAQHTEQQAAAVKHTPPEDKAMKAEQRVDLVVAYRDKDEAKAAGAKWDKQRKTWYAPEGADMAKLAKWTPEAQSVVSERKIDPKDEFADALKKAGLLLDEGQWYRQTRIESTEPQMDGKRYRVRVEGDTGSERSGTYTGHLDGHPAGSIQNWRTGEKTNWKASQKAETLSDADRARLKAEAAEKLAAREAEQAEKHERIARALTELVMVAPPAREDHPYLVAKGLEGSGLLSEVPQDGRDLSADSPVKIARNGREAAELREKHPDSPVFIAGDLLVPASDREGNLTTVQAIGPDGRKANATGGKLAGSYYVATTGPAAEKPGLGGGIVIAEGWATAATIQRECGGTVVAAFNAGNLETVARAIREQHPDRPIVIAGDNDHQRAREVDPRTGQLKENRGKAAAEKAAEAVGGYAAIPTFSAESKGTDWNDWTQENGNEALRKAMTESMLLADRRQLADAHRLGHDAERVSENVRLHQADAELGQGAEQGATTTELADAKSAFAALRNAGERERDRQDVSDELYNGQPAPAPAAGEADEQEQQPTQDQEQKPAQKRSTGRKRGR